MFKRSPQPPLLPIQAPSLHCFVQLQNDVVGDRHLDFDVTGLPLAPSLEARSCAPEQRVEPLERINGIFLTNPGIFDRLLESIQPSPKNLESEPTLRAEKSRSGQVKQRMIRDVRR